MRKRFSGTISVLLVICMLTFMFKIQSVNAGVTIYIKADGSVDPSTAPISVDGNTYTLTDNINGSIVVQKNDIIIDGSGYILRGEGSGKGIDLSQRSNITTKNVTVINFEYGIYLYSATLITLSENNITGNGNYGVLLVSSSNNYINTNYIASNKYGIYLSYSSNNNISKNLFLNSGLFVQNSYNSVVKDNLVNGKPLVYLERVSEDTIEDAGQVILVNCSKITIQNLNISNTTVGVQLLDTHESSIIQNDISNNVYGVVLYGYLRGCSSNNISKNKIRVSGEYGVWLSTASNNNIAENEVSNNSQGIVLSYASNNKISQNDITNNGGSGIWFTSNANQNNIDRNIITKNGKGIALVSSNCSSITNNNITANNLSVSLEGSSNNSINNNNIAGNNLQGIYLKGSLNNDIHENNITNNINHGLRLDGSTNNIICKNNVTANNDGIVLIDSSNNSICENYVMANSNYGICVWASSPGYTYTSIKNVVSRNVVTNNKFGVTLYYSLNNSVSCNVVTQSSNYGIWLSSLSKSNLIMGNNITSNNYGIYIDSGVNNSIYHNNFINNAKQAKTDGYYLNFWDDNYPSGGNYWSNLVGLDVNGDGIIDEPYVIDADNNDRYPLKAPFTTFYAGTWNTIAYNFDIISNSSISSFQFDPNEGPFVRFNVTGADGTYGFCRIAIPKSLLWVEDGWTITVGDQLITDYTVISDDDFTYLYFTYNHSTKTVIVQGTYVIPEFPSSTILSLFMLLSIIAVVFAKKKAEKKALTSKTHFSNLTKRFK